MKFGSERGTVWSLCSFSPKRGKCFFNGDLGLKCKCFLAARKELSGGKRFLVKLSPLHSAITLHLTNGLGGLTKFIKSNLFTKTKPLWKCHDWRDSKPSNDFVGRKESFFVVFLLLLTLKCDSPSPLAFLALCPFVCVCLCGYQPKRGSRSLGAAALPCLMALTGLRTAKKIPAIYGYHPVFIACLLQASLPRRCCAR